MHTVVPHNEGFIVLEHFLELRPNTQPETATLCLTELVLSLNYFLLTAQFYQQISGVAMGTRTVANYVNLFVGYIEAQISSRFTDSTPEPIGSLDLEMIPHSHTVSSLPVIPCKICLCLNYLYTKAILTPAFTVNSS